MGTTSSKLSKTDQIEYISAVIDHMKKEIDIFAGNRTSSRYQEFQKILTLLVSDFQKIKKKSKKQQLRDRCDEVQGQIENCLKKLEAKVNFNEQNENQQANPAGVINQTWVEPVFDSIETLEHIEQETLHLEKEVTTSIELKDTDQLVIYEGKIRILYTDLEIIQVDENTPLSDKKAAIGKKLIKSNNEIKTFRKTVNDTSVQASTQDGRAFSKPSKSVSDQNDQFDELNKIEQLLEDFEIQALTFEGFKSDKKYKELEQVLESHWTKVYALDAFGDDERRRKSLTIERIKNIFQELHERAEENEKQTKAIRNIHRIEQQVQGLKKEAAKFQGTTKDPFYDNFDQELRTLWAKLNEVEEPDENIRRSKIRVISDIQYMLKNQAGRLNDNKIGSSDPVEEVREHIRKLKNEIHIFDGKITSERYSRLQKELIVTNTRVLEIKKSKNTTLSQICDQLLDELNECLKDVMVKVTNNKKDNKFYVPSSEVEEKPKHAQQIARKQVSTFSYQQNYINGEVEVEGEEEEEEEDDEEEEEIDEYGEKVFGRNFYPHIGQQARPKSNLLGFRNMTVNRSDLLKTDNCEYKETSNFSEDEEELDKIMKNKIQSQRNFVTKLSGRPLKSSTHQFRKPYKVRNTDDEATDLITTSEEELAHFTEHVRKYSEEKANSETQEYYVAKESEKTCGNMKNMINKHNMNKPKPPVRSTGGAPKKSFDDSDSSDDEIMQKTLSVGKRIADSRKAREKKEERSNLMGNLKIRRKIRPPIMKQTNNFHSEEVQNIFETNINRKIYPPVTKQKTVQIELLKEQTTSDEEESLQIHESLHEETEERVPPKIIIKKIFAPIPKYMQNQKKHSEQIPYNLDNDKQEDLDLKNINSKDLEENSDLITESIVLKKIYPPIIKPTGGQEPPSENELNDDCLHSFKFIEEEQIEYQSNEEDSDEEKATDALNLNLLKKVTYLTRSCSGNVYEIGFAQSKEEEDSDNDADAVEVEESRKNEKVQEKVEEKAKEDKESKAKKPNQGDYMDVQEKREIRQVKYIKKQNIPAKHKYEKRSSSKSIDYAQKLEEVREDLKELKSMKEDFKQSQDNTMSTEMQKRKVKVIKSMFNINQANFDNNSLKLYESVSQDYHKIMNEL